jgi:hypothetical protein
MHCFILEIPFPLEHQQGAKHQNWRIPKGQYQAHMMAAVVQDILSGKWLSNIQLETGEIN